MAIPYCCQKKFIDIDLLLFIAIYIQHMNNNIYALRNIKNNYF